MFTGVVLAITLMLSGGATAFFTTCPAQPMVDPFSGASCSVAGGYRSALSACVKGISDCAVIKGCFISYFSTMQTLGSLSSITIPLCPSLPATMHAAQLIAESSGYQGSSLQTSCEYNYCDLAGNATVHTCDFGTNFSDVCFYFSPTAPPNPLTPAPSKTTLSCGLPQVPAATTVISGQLVFTGAARSTSVDQGQLTIAIQLDIAALLHIKCSLVVMKTTAVVGALGVNAFFEMLGDGSYDPAAAVTTLKSLTNVNPSWMSYTSAVFGQVLLVADVSVGLVTPSPVTLTPVTQAPSRTGNQTIAPSAPDDSGDDSSMCGTFCFGAIIVVAVVAILAVIAVFVYHRRRRAVAREANRQPWYASHQAELADRTPADRVATDADQVYPAKERHHASGQVEMDFHDDDLGASVNVDAPSTPARPVVDETINQRPQPVTPGDRYD